MRSLACLALPLVLVGCVIYTAPISQTPGAPGAVTAVAGDAQATVTWSVPAQGATPIQFFIITVTPGGFQYSSTGTSATIGGLTNLVSYTFAVQAENSAGIGPAGVSNPVTPQGVAGEPQVGLGPTGNAAGYHGKANASSALPGGAVGYVVTANGGGGFRIFWADTVSSGATFTGSITTDGQFNPPQTVQTGQFTLTRISANQYTWSAIPGAQVQGLDVVSSTEPVYIDGQINGTEQGVAIYFTGATSGLEQTSGVNPVAFTSP